VPNKTLRLVDPQAPEAQLPSWLEGRAQVDGRLTAYVCHHFTCSLPVTEWESLRELLLQ
jgi:uncharacterized protein YyaL (SSP411 family)